MRPLLASFLAIAVGITGILVAIDLALVLGGESPPAGHSQENPVSASEEALVAAFYDAANELLSARDTWAFTSVALPGVRVHLESGTTRAGLDALQSHFLALQRQGDVRLDVARLVGNDNEFTTLIEAHPQSDLPTSPRHDPPLWQAIDHFRIEGGMISDYWPGAVDSRPLPRIPALSLPLAMSDPAVSMARLELGPGGTLRGLDIPNPWLFVVESGQVTLPAPSDAVVARAAEARPDPGQPVERQDAFLLGPGDTVLIPANSGQSVINHGARPAALLSFLFAPWNDLFGPKHSLTRDMLMAAAMHDPARIGTKTEWAAGVVSETLATGALPIGGTGLRKAHLSGAALSVEPGEHVVLSPAPGLRFALVMSGLLSADQSVTPEAVHAIATPSGNQRLAFPRIQLLREGDALAVVPGSQRLLENAGTTRLDLSILEIRIDESVEAPTPTCKPSDQITPDC